MNRLTITNLKAKYIFLLLKGFHNRIIQIFGDPKLEIMAEEKLEML